MRARRVSKIPDGVSPAMPKLVVGGFLIGSIFWKVSEVCQLEVENEVVKFRNKVEKSK
ncbi:MAG: hypothetical protein JSV18_05330 [Candidatus Bathyarchaeota archaeon]|nr:MAG: hypothetical protein JSV18_05330 [Candidatus Bathyarchaeota archaeon]